MNDNCNCCEGIQQLTPRFISNRPGLNALAYRLGTHATFLETMKARLSNYWLDIRREGHDPYGQPRFERVYPLRSLTTRASEDPSIAFLDAWAILADVLTFYQERIANEGYLRTATERRSILELARLVGYALRPGVASTVYLAYTVDSNFKEEAIIPAGARAQSVPGPDELPQTFETSEPLGARAAWNTLKPRLTRPQTARTIGNPRAPRVYLKGISTNLRQNDPLLIDFGDDDPELYRVMEVKPDATADHTLIVLQEWDTARSPQRTIDKRFGKWLNLDDPLSATLGKLTLPASVPPRNALRLGRDITTMFTPQADNGLQILSAFHSELGESAPKALANLKATPDSDIKVYALRLKAAPFGHNAPLKPILDDGKVTGYEEWEIPGKVKIKVRLMNYDGMPMYLNLAAEKDGKSFEKRVPVDPAQSNITIALGEITRVSIEIEKQKISFTFLDLDRAFSASWSGVGSEMTVDIGGISLDITPGKDSEQMVDGDKFKFELFNNQSEDNLSISAELGWPPIIALNSKYEQLTPGSWIIIERPAQYNPESIRQLVRTVRNTRTVSKAEYGITGEVTQLTLNDDWLYITDHSLATLRGTTVFAQSEELELAEEPMTDDICGGKDKPIELDSIYTGLQAGRWLIISGERTDIKAPNPNDPGEEITVQGVKTSELVMLSEVMQDVSMTGTSQRRPLPGDRIHTFIKLAQDLAYCYKRDTVTIYGNVAKATHGETHSEVVGSGDSTQKLQTFILKQAPLTYVAASNPHGVDSTLHVRVNDVEWHEAENLAELGPTDRRFITRTTDDEKTHVIFGNGQQGTRLPTGTENVRATYRSGIGKPGNVKAGQISLLTTRPLGVREVINPLRASGGADKESRDQARKNASLPVLALERLVSTQDYADFARGFAGIGKASATRLSQRGVQLVHVTIAGADDIPIDKTSDLYHSLVKALRDFGDPYLPIKVEMRELLLIVISANVSILPDYLWESVVMKIRTKLVDTFSFERRELGQDVLLSEVISTIQSVEGVAYVDVDVLAGVSEKNDSGTLRTPKEIADQIQDMVDQSKTKGPEARIPVNMADAKHAAQLAFLSPDVEATLILNEVKP